MRARGREQIAVVSGLVVFIGVAIYSGACGSGVVLFTRDGGDDNTSSGSSTSSPGDPGIPTGSPLPPGPPSTNPNTPDAAGVTPSVDCTDAGNTCATPPSPRCIDSQYLASFGSGACVDGKCKYPETTYDCAGAGSNCSEDLDAGSCGTVIVK